MRALVLTNLFPSRQRPTRGTFNLNGFDALARRCDLRLLAPVPWWERLRQPSALVRPPEEEWTGIRAAFPTYWTAPRVGRVLHAQGMYRSLRSQVKRLQREIGFDAILAAWAYPDGVAAAHLARELGLPLVTMVLGSDANEFLQHPGLRKQIRWGLGQAQRTIVVSRALDRRIRQLGIPGERIIVQHNGVDGERFRISSREHARGRLDLDPEARLVTYVGNLVPEKGPDVLVEAAGALAAAGKPVPQIALVGDGPLRPSLEARVRELGLESRVRFHGRQPYEQIPTWISAGDLLCLPSRREGCPNVVLEALASGRPVVASMVGGVPELLSRGNGLLVPADRPKVLAAALTDVLSRPWDPEALRATVPCLSWDCFADTLYTALRDACHEGAANPLLLPA
ncbi:MAG: glycosyltransferase family 4 protein [Armatimonadota bacterium]